MQYLCSIAATVGDIVCEPDEYALLVKDLKASGLIKDHRKGVKVHKNSFSGREFVQWVIKTKQLGIKEVKFPSESNRKTRMLRYRESC